MSESTVVEIYRRDDVWAVHLVGYLAAHESPAVRNALGEAIASAAAEWPVPLVIVGILAELLDQDLADDQPF